jgi:hypothetical protein
VLEGGAVSAVEVRSTWQEAEEWAGWPNAQRWLAGTDHFFELA